MKFDICVNNIYIYIYIERERERERERAYNLMIIFLKYVAFLGTKKV